MALCIVLIGVYFIFFGDASPIGRYRPVFWLESIAIIMFGISWLVKGEAILADLP